MQDDVIINKFESIKNCLKSIRDYYSQSPEDFVRNHMRQDAVILNLQRAAQIAIDIATHIVRLKKLNLPKETKDLFVSLYENKIISKQSEERMMAMVGFRNIAVHEYKKLDLKIVISIIESHLSDFQQFMQDILNAN